LLLWQLNVFLGRQIRRTRSNPGRTDPPNNPIRWLVSSDNLISFASHWLHFHSYVFRHGNAGRSSMTSIYGDY
jgi:hypothetical protein